MAPKVSLTVRSRGVAPGFTLIEVMLAVVILGLGVLGLSALFAGAAVQQQRGSEVNLSVGAARSAEALLARSFGRIAGLDLPDINDGEWYAVSSKAGAGGRDPNDWSLTLDPSGNGRLYFLVKADPTDVFISQFDAANPPTSAQDGLAIDAWTNTSGPFPPGNATGNDIRPLPHSRIHPGSFERVEVVIADVGGASRTVPLVVQSGAPLQDPGMEDEYAMIVLESVPGPLTEAVTSDAGVAAALESHYVADTMGVYEYMVLQLAEGTAPAVTGQVIAFHLRIGPTEWIERITVPDEYEWRNDRLVSLNDRLVYETDSRFPGGRRPSLGYTALYRRLAAGGSSQLTIFTYALQPTGSPGTDPRAYPFVPPETFNLPAEDSRRLVRLASTGVDLGYDEQTAQYYVRVPDDDDHRWLVAPGQILMVASSVNPMPPPARGPGSDIPVKVVSQRTDDQGRLIGVLDRGPRVLGRSLLDDLAGDPQPIVVWALSPLVKSLSADGGEWRVRPIEARQFQIVTQ